MTGMEFIHEGSRKAQPGVREMVFCSRIFLFSTLSAHDILTLPGEDGFSPCFGGGHEVIEKQGRLWYPFLDQVGCARLVLMPAKGGSLA